MVLISGSGPDNRDAAPRWMPGYQPFWQIADALTRHGIAVLRIDDRGVGLSTGEFEKATIVDFADDVRNALAYLRSRPDIDGSRLAILGHSEGGVVATMVAAEDPSLKGLVLLASPGTNLRSVVADQLRYWLERDPAVPFANRERLLVQQLARWDVYADASPRLKFSRTYNPSDAAKRISAPVLILQGAADRQVPRKHAEKLAKALRESGNPDVTLRILPYVDHLFLQDRSGNPGGYSQLTSRRIPGSVLDELGGWVASHLGAPNPSSIGTGGEAPPRSAAPSLLAVPKQ
jgi:dipeptidyl aminopeptidase/acylaminoacyl peptidase